MKEKKLTGHFLYFDQKNLNGRTYSREVAEKIVADFNMKKSGKAESPKGSSGGMEPGNQWYQNPIMLGQLGYPPPDQFGINLGEVSHEVEEIHINEENLSIDGTIKLLETPKGKIAEELLFGENAVGLSCRPRGTGEVNENGEIENFNIISFDLISKEDAFANIKENDHLKPLDDEV